MLRRAATDSTSASSSAPPVNRLPRLAPSTVSSPSCPARAAARRCNTAALVGRLLTITSPLFFSYQRKAGTSSFEPCRMPSWLAPVWLDQSVRHGVTVWLPPTHVATVSMTGGLLSRGRSASRSTACPTPSSWRKTVPAAAPGPPSAPLRRRARSASRASRRRYAPSSRTVRKVLVAEDAADIAAATTTAVSGSTAPRPSGISAERDQQHRPVQHEHQQPQHQRGHQQQRPHQQRPYQRAQHTERTGAAGGGDRDPRRAVAVSGLQPEIGQDARERQHRERRHRPHGRHPEQRSPRGLPSGLLHAVASLRIPVRAGRADRSPALHSAGASRRARGDGEWTIPLTTW